MSGKFVKGQFGAGLTFGYGLYNWYQHPNIASDTLKRSSGATGGFHIGPKLWVGRKNFSVSVEGQINYTLFTLDLAENKGMGSLDFPIMLLFNFKGLANLYEPEFYGWGLSFGGGIQYSKTELYSIPDEFKDIDRPFFRTYIFNVNLGYALGRQTIYWHFRFGFNEQRALSLNYGISWGWNFIRE